MNDSILNTYNPKGTKLVPKPPKVNTTRLLVSEDGGPWRVMNTIDNISNFRSVPTPADMNDFNSQLRVARMLADGWKQNGYHRFPKYMIVQFQPTRQGTMEKIYEERV